MGRGDLQGGIPGPVPEGLTVFETMRANDGCVALWPLHLARLRRGCALLGFPLDETRLAEALADLPPAGAFRFRISVDSDGAVQATHAPLPPNPSHWIVAISDHRLDPADPWLQIKSSHRPIYDAARAEMPPECDEMLLLNTRGELCEGTITSIFLRSGGVLLTPPLGSGLLPGVLRAHLLDRGDAVEMPLRPGDLKGAELLLGNALRGLIPAVLRH